MSLAVKVATFCNKKPQVPQSVKKEWNGLESLPTSSQMRVQYLGQTLYLLWYWMRTASDLLCEPGLGSLSSLKAFAYVVGQDQGPWLMSLKKSLNIFILVVSACALEPHRNSWPGRSLCITCLHSRYTSCTKCALGVVRSFQYQQKGIGKGVRFSVKTKAWLNQGYTDLNLLRLLAVQ